MYVLDSLGKAKPGWPLQMGEIQAQVCTAAALCMTVPLRCRASEAWCFAAKDAQCSLLLAGWTAVQYCSSSLLSSNQHCNLCPASSTGDGG